MPRKIDNRIPKEAEQVDVVLSSVQEHRGILLVFISWLFYYRLVDMTLRLV